MNRYLSSLLRQCSLLLLLSVAVNAHAGLTTVNFSGAVTGYWIQNVPVADDFPIGTPVSMNLTYNDSFLGQPASTFYLGMSPAVSGTLNLGGNLYALNAMSLTYFTYGPTLNDPSPNYGFHVTGSGPTTDDGEPFAGLDLRFGLGTLGHISLIGFGNPNWLVADNGYFQAFGQTSWERSLPIPGTIWLLGSALAALTWRRRRQEQAA